MAQAADIRQKYRVPDSPEPLRGADVSRERLLQATHELLLETGGAEPSVSQISARAGMQPGMVSYCFGGKRQLLDALMLRSTEHVMEELRNVAAADMPATEKLRRHVRRMVANFVRFPYTQHLSERLTAADPGIQPFAEHFAAPTLEFYRNLVAEGVAAGEFRAEIDSNLLFFSTVGMCEFLFAAKSWLPLAGEQLDEALIERFADHCANVLLTGITPNS